MKRKVLVTGGAGFIGSNLVEKLLSLGNHVIVIDNESTDAHESFYWNENAENYKYDITDYDLIYSLFDKVDTVFHAAAESRIQPSIQNPQLAIKSNIVGTANVLQAAKENKVRRFVYSTTSSYYGKKNTLPNIETQQDDCLNVYCISKVTGEKLCKMYYDIYGLETISLRYFNVYGKNQPTKGQYAPVVGLFLKQKKNGTPLTIVGDGTQRRDFTHIDDVVNANILSMTCNLDSYGETFNVGGGKNYSILDLAEMISDNITFIPPRIGECKEVLSDTTKINKAMGWAPKTSLDDWIKNNI